MTDTWSGGIGCEFQRSVQFSWYYYTTPFMGTLQSLLLHWVMALEEDLQYSRTGLITIRRPFAAVEDARHEDNARTSADAGDLVTSRVVITVRYPLLKSADAPAINDTEHYTKCALTSVLRTCVHVAGAAIDTIKASKIVR
jgi:hypothetical protein